MKKWLCAGIFLLLAGCGSDSTPTRPNDFTLLTSIEIVSPTTLSTIAPLTSIPLKAIGNFSGLFTRDITDRVLWTSASNTVADFAFAAVPGRIKGLAPGVATLSATLGDITASFDLEVTAATITALTIAPAAPSIPKGLTIQLTANGTFSGGSTQDLTFDSLWSSDTPTIATVSNALASKGLATGITQGTAGITATFDTLTSQPATLEVTNAILQSITLAPTNPSILSVFQTPFSASGHYSDGTVVSVTNEVSWSSTQPNIATIATGGMATTLREGTTTIAASLAGVRAQTTLRVTGGNLNSIALSPATPTLVLGTTKRLIATGTFSNGTSRDISGRVTWSTDPPAPASVAKEGTLAWLHGDAAGATTVRAQWDAVTGTSDLAVNDLTLTALAISPAALNLITGTSDRFTVRGTFSGGTTQDLTYSAEWNSPASTIKVLNSGIDKGRIQGLAATLIPATVTAAFGAVTSDPAGKVDSVVDRILESLSLAGSTTLTPGTQTSFTVTATYSNGSTHNVTEDLTAWAIDTPDVAILPDSTRLPGVLIAVDSGTATLTVTFGGKTATQTITVP